MNFVFDTRPKLKYLRKIGKNTVGDMFDYISKTASSGHIDPVPILHSSMSPSPPLGIKKLTSYFSLSSSPRKRCLAINVDDENEWNGLAMKRPRASHEGATAATAVDISNSNLDVSMALQRIESYDKSSAMRAVRAGDDGVFLIRRGATIGRSVNPNTNGNSIAMNYRHRKMNLGIYGSDSGVSRKQLVVQRVAPVIKMKQLISVTNQVYVVRYNPLTRAMESHGTYVQKDAEFVLKKGDVLVMDHGRVKPNYIFRVVDCYVPRSSSVARKPVIGQVQRTSPSRRDQTIDLVSAPSRVPSASSSTILAERIEPCNQLSATQTISTATPHIVADLLDPIKDGTPERKEPMTKRLIISKLVKAEEPAPSVSLIDAAIPNEGPLHVYEKSTLTKQSTSDRRERELTPVAEVILPVQKHVKAEEPAPAATHLDAAIQSEGTLQQCRKSTRTKQNVPESREREFTTLADVIVPLQKHVKVEKRAPPSALLDAAILNAGPISASRKSTLRKPIVPESQETEPAMVADVTVPVHADEAPVRGPRQSRLTRADVASLSMAIEPPKVGDFVRVLYESQDTFLRFRTSWWFATVQGVKKLRSKGTDGKPTHQLSLLFRDLTVGDHDFPGDDVQKLKIDSSSGFAHVLKPIESESDKGVAFDLNPDILEIGDLVDALYQDGRESGKWYRGRIAAFDSSTRTCTIAYEDGDAESGVPLGQGKIILVEKGCTNPTWLTELDVYDDFLPRIQKKSPLIPKDVIGRVEKIEEDSGEALIVVSFSQKKRARRLSYNDFVSYLFESLLSRYQSLKTWPTNSSTTLPHRTVRKGFRGKSSDNRDGAKTIEAVEMKPPSLLRQKACTKANEEVFREEDWDITATAPSPLTKTEAGCVQEMPLTVANSFLRSLNSTDPGIGADLLIQMAVCHKRGMNSSLGRHVRDLLCEGPTSEGTHFPDKHRVEVTLKYLDALIGCEGGELNLSRSCSPDEWAAVQEMMECIVTPQYIFDGDDVCSTSEGWDRIADSLHLMKSGAVFLSMLFKAELREEMCKKTPDKAKCREGPLATAIWSNSSGARNSVKAVLKVYASSWMKHGHHVLCDFAVLKGTPGAPLSTTISTCRDEAKRMLRELGSVVSYVLWLYLVCEGVRTNTRELAWIIAEVYECEALRGDFDPSVFMKAAKVPASYLKTHKLCMILGIDDSVVTGLRFDLARKLGVEKEFKLIAE